MEYPPPYGQGGGYFYLRDNIQLPCTLEINDDLAGKGKNSLQDVIYLIVHEAVTVVIGHRGKF